MSDRKPPVVDAAPVVEGIDADGRGPSGSAALGYYAFLSLGTSVAIQGIAVITGVLTARFLGPTGKGEWSALFLWTGVLVTVGYLGMPEAITYFTARRPGRRKAVFGTSLAAAAAQSVVLAAVGWLVLPVALQSYGESVSEDARLFLWWVPLNLVTIYSMSVLAGGLRFAAYNAVRLSVGVAAAAGLVVVALAGAMSVHSVVMVYLGANVLTAIAAVVACQRLGWTGVRLDRRLLKDILGYGLRTHTASVSSMVNQRADQMMVSLFLGPAQLGLYATALTFTAAVNLVGSSVAVVGMPAVAGAADHAAGARVLAYVVRVTLVASTLAAAALFVLVPMLLEFLFGPAFVPASGVARLLLVAAIILSANQVLMSGLRGLGRPLAAGIAELVALPVTALALAVLLPPLGLLGAGLALLLGSGSTLACTLAFVCRRLDVPLSELLVPRSEDVLRIARLARSEARTRLGTGRL